MSVGHALQRAVPDTAAVAKRACVHPFSTARSAAVGELTLDASAILPVLRDAGVEGGAARFRGHGTVCALYDYS
jgi:hypothetical protein